MYNIFKSYFWVNIKFSNKKKKKKSDEITLSYKTVVCLQQMIMYT